MRYQGRHDEPVFRYSQLARFKRCGLPSIAVVTVVASLITLGGIYGYRDQAQHKTNVLEMPLLEQDVFLIGHGEGQTPRNWQVGQTLKREIRVKNGGAQATANTSSFEPIYIRVNLDEFLEFGRPVKQYSLKRYLLDSSNQLVKFSTSQAALAFINARNLPVTILPEQVVSEADLIAQGSTFLGYWYLAVNGLQPQGWHSERLVLSTQLTGVSSLISGVANARQDVADKHQDDSNGEDDYTTHLFASDLSPLGVSQAFEAYLTLGFSKDVVSIAQWLVDDGGKPVKKWLVDTGNTNGWVYWGEPLAAKATTANLLETVTLRDKPQGKTLYYAIHADLDAINQEALNRADTWSDLPKALREAWQATD